MSRVISISIKPSDKRSKLLLDETRKVIVEKSLPSFSYVMIQALREYMEKHHDING